MKLVILMYLAEDDHCVAGLLKQLDIEAFSRLPVEGHGPGAKAGWYGETAPYQSRMVMSILADEQAAALMRAVEQCTGVQDPRHPIRAALLNVEQTVCCEYPP